MAGENGGSSIEEQAQTRQIDQAFKGVMMNWEKFQRQDGIITKSIDDMNKHQGGVILSFANANSDEEYRQILKHARWKDQEQRVKYVKALSDCRLTGARNATITLLDLVTANTAGDDGALIHESYDALTHTTFTTNNDNKKKGWLNNGASSGSPTSSVG